MAPAARDLNGMPVVACYTPRLTAATGRSNAEPATERAREGASRAGTSARTSPASRDGRRPIPRREGTGSSGRDERDRPGAEPAGGTTTPCVRWTSGSFDSRAQTMTDTTDTTETNAGATSALPKAYRPVAFEGKTYARWQAADVFAPDRAGC